jgi:UDP-2,3-diacylglucosamine hydrolase
LTNPKKYYFLSDAHLGIPDYESSLVREKKLVRWLDTIKNDAAGVFFLGDVFDFWFEYKDVVPKYFVRLLGKIADLTDSGIPVWFFTGNHDMWTFGYLEKELNVRIVREPLRIKLFDKLFFLAHGDGLGPKDHGYKVIKSVFRNKLSKNLFSSLHPRIGFSMANFSSLKSRLAHSESDNYYAGEQAEVLILFAKEKIKEQHFDFFVFGHRHLALNIKISDTSSYINLGDWITKFTFGEFDGEYFFLKTFTEE